MYPASDLCGDAPAAAAGHSGQLDVGTTATTLESRRWVEGYERVAERAQKLPDTRLVYVADREADMRLS